MKRRTNMPGIFARVCFGLLLAAFAHAQDFSPDDPYRSRVWQGPETEVDRIAAKTLGRQYMDRLAPASDAVFLRRASLDLTGTPPAKAEVLAFLADKNPEKRSGLIRNLVERPAFSEYLGLKWGDLLRIKSEFPSNLWPNAVQAYDRWIREALVSGMPYDRFVRSLLTAAGSNFRQPAVNFYRALPARDPPSIASAVALTFMGQRYEKLSDSERADMAKFFSRVAYKKTLEWKEEIVYLDPASQLANPERFRLPDGSLVSIGPGADPRIAFADWLTGAGSMVLAQAFANKVWYWLMGQGIVEPADDMGPGARPADPELLDYLASAFIASGWDVRSLFVLVADSRLYQQAMMPGAGTASGSGAEAAPGTAFAARPSAYAIYSIRRLDAEVLADMLADIGGKGETYVSPIPEPFTYVPPTQRTISLADGSITSSFLVKFGRPSRDTGLLSERDNAPNSDQVLYFLNSTDLRKKFDSSPRLSPIYSLPAAKRDEQIRSIYLELISRPPTRAEAKTAKAYFSTPGLGSRQAAQDLAWALANGKEFIYRH